MLTECKIHVLCSALLILCVYVDLVNMIGDEDSHNLIFWTWWFSWDSFILDSELFLNSKINSYLI